MIIGAILESCQHWHNRGLQAKACGNYDPRMAGLPDIRKDVHTCGGT